MSIVVRYADSAEGRAALSWAVGECSARDRALVVMAVETPALAADLSQPTEVLGSQLSVRSVPSEDALEDELLDLSYEDETQLVVIGIRRRSPLGKLLLGSDSQRLLLEAACPVTAVKPPVGRTG